MINMSWLKNYQIGDITIAQTPWQQWHGLNQPGVNKMAFPVLDDNQNRVFRGTDDGKPVQITDSKGKTKILRGNQHTDTFQGDVYEQRLPKAQYGLPHQQPFQYLPDDRGLLKPDVDAIRRFTNETITPEMKQSHAYGYYPTPTPEQLAIEAAQQRSKNDPSMFSPAYYKKDSTGRTWYDRNEDSAVDLENSGFKTPHKIDGVNQPNSWLDDFSPMGWLQDRAADLQRGFGNSLKEKSLAPVAKSVGNTLLQEAIGSAVGYGLGKGAKYIKSELKGQAASPAIRDLADENMYTEDYPINGVYTPRKVLTDPLVADRIVGNYKQPLIDINHKNYGYQPEEFGSKILRPGMEPTGVEGVDPKTIGKNQQIWNNIKGNTTSSLNTGRLTPYQPMTFTDDPGRGSLSWNNGNNLTGNITEWEQYPIEERIVNNNFLREKPNVNNLGQYIPPQQQNPFQRVLNTANNAGNRVRQFVDNVRNPAYSFRQPNNLAEYLQNVSHDIESEYINMDRNLGRYYNIPTESINNALINTRARSADEARRLFDESPKGQRLEFNSGRASIIRALNNRSSLNDIKEIAKTHPEFTGDQLNAFSTNRRNAIRNIQDDISARYENGTIASQFNRDMYIDNLFSDYDATGDELINSHNHRIQAHSQTPNIGTTKPLNPFGNIISNENSGKLLEESGLSKEHSDEIISQIDKPKPTTGSYSYNSKPSVAENNYKIKDISTIPKTEDLQGKIDRLEQGKAHLSRINSPQSKKLLEKIEDELSDLYGTQWLRVNRPKELALQGKIPNHNNLTLSTHRGNSSLLDENGKVLGNISTSFNGENHILGQSYSIPSARYKAAPNDDLGDALYRSLFNGKLKGTGKPVVSHGNFAALQKIDAKGIPMVNEYGNPIMDLHAKRFWERGMEPKQHIINGIGNEKIEGESLPFVEKTSDGYYKGLRGLAPIGIGVGLGAASLQDKKKLGGLVKQKNWLYAY